MSSAIRVFAVTGVFFRLFSASAQETRSMIYGHVYDAQKAAVTGANVVIRNVDTNVSGRLKTNETGYYEANLLLPGGYQVSADRRQLEF